jgi:hypothetical protein
MSHQEQVFKFYWNSPRDVLAMTHGEQFPNELVPEGMQSLVGTTIDNQLAMMGIVRDETGKAVGVLSELEIFGRNAESEFEVYLTMVLPGRGALVVREMKSMVFPEVVEPYKIATEKGKWEGSVNVVHTSGPLHGRHGDVIAATGEFAGMTGRQQQTAIYKKIEGNVTVVEVCETFWLTAKR